MAHLTGTFRLGRDAEKHSSEKGEFLTLSLAYDVYDGGETRAQWIRATLGGDRAKKLAEHLVKGAQVCAVIKDPQLVEFKDKDGVQRSAMEGRIIDLDFVGSTRKAEDKASATAET